MRKLFIFAILAVSQSLAAQTIIPSFSPTSTTAAGQPTTLTVTYTAGTAVASLEWIVTSPAGTTFAWTVGPPAETVVAKWLYLGPITVSGTTQTQTLVAAGVNITAMPSGIIGQASVVLPATARGAQTFTITGTNGASPTAVAVAVTGGSSIVTAFDPYDLNGNGLTTPALLSADLNTAMSQSVGLTPCTTANFGNDGCKTVSLILLIIDLLSANP